jgi:integrase
VSPCDDPDVRAVLAGVRRSAAKQGRAPLRSEALTVERLGRAIATIDRGTPNGLRDAALLTLGFSLGARRSELVALDVADVVDDGEGLTVAIRRSKSDQTGEGAVVYVPPADHADLCAVRAVRAWCAAVGLTSGPLFRSVNRHGQLGPRLSDRRVDAIVRRVARRAGLEGRYSAHSMRSGVVTSLAARGRTETEIMRITRHKSSSMIRRYTREVDAKRTSPLRGAW